MRLDILSLCDKWNLNAYTTISGHEYLNTIYRQKPNDLGVLYGLKTVPDVSHVCVDTSPYVPYRSHARTVITASYGIPIYKLPSSDLKTVNN